MSFITWYKIPQNREAFENKVMPLMCVANGRVIGGLYKIMYQKWVWEMVLSMESYVSHKMIKWEKTPKGEQNEGDLYPVFDYYRIELVFGLYTRLLNDKWIGLCSIGMRDKIEKDKIEYNAWLNRPSENLVNTSIESPKEIQLKWRNIESERLDTDINIPLPSFNAKQGWLSRTGELYPCDETCHNRLQAGLEKVLQIKDLEKAGWMKLGKSRESLTWFSPDLIITEAQISAIESWCKYHDQDFPKYLIPDFSR
jgi:hypothetical protein